MSVLYTIPGMKPYAATYGVHLIVNVNECDFFFLFHLGQDYVQILNIYISGSLI